MRNFSQLPVYKSDIGKERVLTQKQEARPTVQNKDKSVFLQVEITLHLVIQRTEESSGTLHFESVLLSDEKSEKLTFSLKTFSYLPFYDISNFYKQEHNQFLDDEWSRLCFSPFRMLRWLFYGCDIVDIVLFEKYEEKEDSPLHQIQVSIAAKFNKDLPVVHEAILRVTKHLGIVLKKKTIICCFEGIFNRFLSTIRPSDTASWVWTIGGALLVVCGSFMILFIFWVMKWFSGENRNKNLSKDRNCRPQSTGNDTSTTSGRKNSIQNFVQYVNAGTTSDSELRQRRIRQN